MIINHNISALNTYRQLTGNTQAASKSLEKLSSGFRINRAADDAAGLAISEKMRGQIRGLAQAQRNAQDGISLIQTAEGALNETHSILQRMRELAVQAANDTNTASDRRKLQAEIDQLAEELTRIGQTTEFNTQKLLNGTFEGTFHIGANQGQNLSLTIGDMRSFQLGVAGEVQLEQEVNITNSDNTQDIADGTYEVIEDENTPGTYNLVDSSGKVVATSTNGTQFTAVNGDDTFTFSNEVTSGTVKIASGKATGTATFANAGIQAGSYKLDAAGGAGATRYLRDANGDIVGELDGKEVKDADGNTLFEFDAAPGNDAVELTVGGTDISSQKAADAAITTINNALELVSEQRSALGAVQNRLEHTVNNLGATEENLTASESRIRDVDMAKEMMEFTKNNILTQAAQAMLAQANQQPQGVLQLLR
jgi:flagellin